MGRVIHGRKISKGSGEGPALVSNHPFSFVGDIDPTSGVIIQRGHELAGQTVKGKVFIFPYGKGSTAGSWVLYSMADYGTAPSAIINLETETIVAVGAIVGNIPMVDKPDQDLFGIIKTGDWVKVDADRGVIEVTGQ